MTNTASESPEAQYSFATEPRQLLHTAESFAYVEVDSGLVRDDGHDGATVQTATDSGAGDGLSYVVSPPEPLDRIMSSLTSGELKASVETFQEFVDALGAVEPSDYALESIDTDDESLPLTLRLLASLRAPDQTS